MATMVAIIGVFFIAGISTAYLLGHATGKREGFEEGKEAGKREGSVKAFAVGYDRGKHDREVEKKKEEEEEEPAPKRGCLLLLLILTPVTLSTIGLFLLV